MPLLALGTFNPLKSVGFCHIRRTAVVAGFRLHSRIDFDLLAARQTEMRNIVGNALFEFIVVWMVSVDLLANLIDVEGVSVAPSFNGKVAGIAGKANAFSHLTSAPITPEFLPPPPLHKGKENP